MKHASIIAAHKTQTTNEETERLFKINLVAHFALVREFLPAMLRMRKGHIVTIASMASFWVAENLVDYACAKVGALFFNDGNITSANSSFSSIDDQQVSEPSATASTPAAKGSVQRLCILPGTRRASWLEWRKHWLSRESNHVRRSKCLIASLSK